jgi:NAD(P)-dependent dehydrogenase (short-subunit alcohol dehydrogenase family)
MDDLRGRVAFVTGGAQGIGLGIARALAGRGVSIAVVDVDELALERAAAELRTVTDVATFVLDVRDRDGFLAVADDAERRLGPVSILCNNAGVMHGVHASKISAEQWDWVMGINLGGVFNGLLAFVPRLLDRGDGHIVNTASVAGLVAGGGGSGWLYHASKFGVVGMTEALREDLAPHGVGVSLLCPGPVATDIIRNAEHTRPPTTPAPLTSQSGIEADWLHGYLATGTRPDVVGEQVAAAIGENRLYVYTDDSAAGPLRRRTAALLAAIPRP